MRKICIISFALLMCLSLVSCGKPKTALFAGEFQSQMKQAGYEVVDVTEQFSSYDAYEAVLVALNENDGYQVEFYATLTENHAVQAFNSVKENFESEKGSASSFSSVSVSNYSKYSQTSNGKYYVVSRIGNTLIYSVTESGNKDAVNSVLKALDY